MKKISGFTLLEMILTISLIGIISIFGAKMLQESFEAYYVAKDVSDADWQGRVALERMTREIRDVRSATSTDLTLTHSNEITFIDKNGVTIRYYRNAGTQQLMRQQNGGTAREVADGINSLTFSYYDQDLTSTGTVSAVRYIQVQLVVTQGISNQTLRAMLIPRNFV